MPRTHQLFQSLNLKIQVLALASLLRIAKNYFSSSMRFVFCLMFQIMSRLKKSQIDQKNKIAFFFLMRGFTSTVGQLVIKFSLSLSFSAYNLNLPLNFKLRVIWVILQNQLATSLDQMGSIDIKYGRDQSGRPPRSRTKIEIGMKKKSRS